MTSCKGNRARAEGRASYFSAMQELEGQIRFSPKEDYQKYETYYPHGLSVRARIA